MEDVIIVNKMEESVKQMLSKVLETSAMDHCTCHHCTLDIIALTLNSLPPKYVVTSIGNAVTGVDLESSQWQANITMAIYKAIEIVKRNPRHS